jgi:ATP-dependent helicase HepA
MTVTYNRNVALANEDMQYLSWEHPFVRDSMDMVLSSEFGNTALIALKHTSVKPGSLLAECHFLMDFSDDYKLNSQRYFPNASIVVLIDESGEDHAARLNLDALKDRIQAIDRDTAIKVMKARQTELSEMLAQAELKADKQVPDLVAAARGQGRELLGREIDRLEALQKVNPGVRDAEIEFFKDQLDHFEKALTHARLRLDAVRVIVVV